MNRDAWIVDVVTDGTVSSTYHVYEVADLVKEVTSYRDHLKTFGEELPLLWRRIIDPVCDEILQMGYLSPVRCEELNRRLRAAETALSQRDISAPPIRVRVKMSPSVIQLEMVKLLQGKGLDAGFLGEERESVGELRVKIVSLAFELREFRPIPPICKVFKGWENRLLTLPHPPEGEEKAERAMKLARLNVNMTLSLYEALRAPWMSKAKELPSGAWLIECDGMRLSHAVELLLSSLLSRGEDVLRRSPTYIVE